MSVSAPEPAGEPDRLARGLELLASRYKISSADHLRSVEGYLSAAPAALAADLHAACQDPVVDGVVFAAG
ncbi:MAG: LD-carboxypeptidase, partial [Solirubrobacteraceae bacterium]